MGHLQYSWYFRQRTGHIYQENKVQFILTGRRLGHLGRCPLGKQNKTKQEKQQKNQVKQQNKKQEVVNYIERLFFTLPQHKDYESNRPVSCLSLKFP